MSDSLQVALWSALLAVMVSVANNGVDRPVLGGTLVVAVGAGFAAYLWSESLNVVTAAWLARRRRKREAKDRCPTIRGQ